MFTQSGRRLSSRFAAAILVFLVMTMLAEQNPSAQGSPYGTIAIATAQGYDGNLLSTADAAGVHSDTFTRVGPIIDGGYSWNRVKVGGRYSFDADRYRQYNDLNRLFAREEAGVELRTVATPRFRLSGDASYLATETPADLNLDTLLIAGRRPATRFTAMASAIYETTPVTAIVVSQSFTRDTLAGGVGNDTHASRFALDYRTSARNTIGVIYELRRILFTNTIAVREFQMFHVARARWAYALTPFTRIELEGGPHIAEDGVRPEVSAVLRRESRRGDVSIGYSREQTTTIGEIGLLDVQRVAGGGTFRPVPRVSLTATPAVAYNLRNRLNAAEKTVPVYTIDGEAAFRASDRFAIVLTGRWGRQEGALQMLSGPNETIVDNRFMAQAVVTLVKGRPSPGDWPRAAGAEE